MTITKSLAKVLAPFIAVALAIGAFAAVSMTSVSTADAAGKPKVKIKTKAPYKKNQKIKIKVSGFPATAPVAVGICPAKIKVPGGVGDCGASIKNYSQLNNTNAKGKLTVTLNAAKGKLFASNHPTAKCNNKKKNKCRVYASTIGGTAIAAKSKVLKY